MPAVPTTPKVCRCGAAADLHTTAGPTCFGCFLEPNGPRATPDPDGCCCPDDCRCRRSSSPPCGCTRH